MVKKEQFYTITFMMLLLSILSASNSQQQQQPIDRETERNPEKEEKSDANIRTLEGNLIEKSKWKRLLKKGTPYDYSKPEDSKNTRWIELVFLKKVNKPN